MVKQVNKAVKVIKSVLIEIDAASDNLKYTPAQLRAWRNDDIDWQCGYPFAIQFTGASPCVAAGYQSGGPQAARGKVRADAQPGTYPYACAVYANDKVYLDAACPVIIIDP